MTQFSIFENDFTLQNEMHSKSFREDTSCVKRNTLSELYARSYPRYVRCNEVAREEKKVPEEPCNTQVNRDVFV